MSDEDDLFLDSDDDDSPKKKVGSGKKPAAAAAAANKKPAPKKKAPAAEDDKNLFESSEESDDDDEDGRSKEKSKAASSAKKSKPAAAPIMSRKDRLEALAKKKRTTDDSGGGGGSSLSRQKASSSRDNNNDKAKKDGGKKESGYDSGDSYNSAEFQRTKEDDDFIDTTGEDADVVAEYLSEQHFNDERGDDDDDDDNRTKKRKRDHRDRDPREALEVNEDGVPLNPVMAAVHRMKRKKPQKMGLEEKESILRTFVGKMELAAEEDEQAIAERRPAMNKLQFLAQVEEMMAKKDMTRDLLSMDVLGVCKRWIQPMPDGKLGNVTVRQRILAAISGMNTNNDNGIQAEDLRRSGIGKVVMVLLKHPDETPNIKRMCKDLVDQWSRPIFGRSANMKDLERSGRQGTGLAAIKRHADAQQFYYEKQEQAQKRVDGGKHANLQSLIAGGKSAADTRPSANRVRVPYSKGFAFCVRPEKRGDLPQDPKSRGPPPVKDNRGKLAKRMLEKGRPMTKNQRSANISVEGRATK